MKLDQTDMLLQGPKATGNTRAKNTRYGNKPSCRAQKGPVQLLF